jgi:hypothetical protein
MRDSGMYDYGDGFVTIFARAYCTNDFGDIVPASSEHFLLAAIQYAWDYHTNVRFFEKPL